MVPSDGSAPSVEFAFNLAIWLRTPGIPKCITSFEVELNGVSFNVPRDASAVSIISVYNQAETRKHCDGHGGCGGHCHCSGRDAGDGIQIQTNKS